MDIVVELVDTIGASGEEPTLEGGEEDGDLRETVCMEAREEGTVKEVSSLAAATHGKVTIEVKVAITTDLEDMETQTAIDGEVMAEDIMRLVVNRARAAISLIDKFEMPGLRLCQMVPMLDMAHQSCCLPGQLEIRRMPASPNVVPGASEGAGGVLHQQQCVRCSPVTRAER